MKLKRWLPFIIMLGIAVVAFINLVFFPDDQYHPDTDDPDLIYYEACTNCHGENGQGSGLLYPAFDSTWVSREVIRKSIVDGGWLMPQFKNIKADTLEKLVNYIYEQKYNNR